MDESSSPAEVEPDAPRSWLAAVVVAGAVCGATCLLVGPLFFVLPHWAPIAGVLVVAGLGLGLLRLARRRTRQGAYAMGFLAAFVAMSVAVEAGKFIEGGLDDGPFYARRFAGDLATLTRSMLIPYREGELLVFNRADRAAPVLAYVVGDETRWALELGGGAKDRSRMYAFNGPTYVRYGRLRDRVDFTCRCSFGTERAHLYLPRLGGTVRFYMSW